MQEIRPKKSRRRIKELIRLFGMHYGLSRDGVKRLLPVAYQDVVHNWWGGRTDRPRSQMDVIVVLSAMGLTELQLALCIALLDYPPINLFRNQLNEVEQNQLDVAVELLADPIHDLRFIRSSAFERLIELGYDVKGEEFRLIIDQYHHSILNKDELTVLELMAILPEPVKESYLLLLGSMLSQNFVDALASLQNYQLVEAASHSGYLVPSDQKFIEFIKRRMSQSRESYYMLLAIKLIAQLSNNERTDLAELYEQVVPYYDAGAAKLLIEEKSSRAETARFHIMLGEAYVLWTKYDAGEKNLYRGLNLLNRFPPVRHYRVFFDLLYATLRYFLIRLRQQLRPRWPSDRETYLLASRGYSRLVEVKYHKGETLASINYSMRSLIEAEKAGDSKELAEALTPIGNLYFFLKLRRPAAKLFARATKMIKAIENTFEGHYVYLVKSTFEMGSCDWEGANDSVQTMIRMARGKGIYRRLQDGLQLKAIYAYLRGEIDDGLIASDELLRLATRHANIRFKLFAHFSLAYLNYLRGTFAEGLRESLALDQQIRHGETVVYDHQLWFNHLALLSMLYFVTGEEAQALQYAEEAERYYEGRFKSSFYTLPGYTLVAKLYLSLWCQNLDERLLAEKYRKKSVQAVWHLKQFSAVFPLGQSTYSLYHGLLLSVQGKERRATAVWQEGVRRAKTLDLPLTQLQLRSCLTDGAQRFLHGKPL